MPACADQRLSLASLHSPSPVSSAPPARVIPCHSSAMSTRKPTFADLNDKFDRLSLGKSPASSRPPRGQITSSPSPSPARFLDGLGEKGGNSLSTEEREAIRLSMVKRTKNFEQMERVNGKLTNILSGLELHTGVFSAAEQSQIVDCIYEVQEKGRKGMLRERTYSEPRKWMRGKGRVTIQFGCCYNYAEDKNGNPPGIVRDKQVDPIPPLLKSMIKRMVEWRVLPATCIPNSCIVNIYEKDDCIPPHIDHHDFLRPFCTVSFLSECQIVLGTSLKVLGPGEFFGSTAITLPTGSVLVLNGNGADVAKHCIPAVPSKRISITFRKMDERKIPFKFSPDPELMNLRPLPYPSKGLRMQQTQTQGSLPPIPTVSPVGLDSEVQEKQNPGNQSKEVNQSPKGGVSGQQLQSQSPSFLKALQVQSRGSSASLVPPAHVSNGQNTPLKGTQQKMNGSYQLRQDDFPPLGSGTGHTRSRPRGLSH